MALQTRESALTQWPAEQPLPRRQDSRSCAAFARVPSGAPAAEGPSRADSFPAAERPGGCAATRLAASESGDFLKLSSEISSENVFKTNFFFFFLARMNKTQLTSLINMVDPRASPCSGPAPLSSERRPGEGWVGPEPDLSPGHERVSRSLTRSCSPASRVPTNVHESNP